MDDVIRRNAAEDDDYSSYAHSAVLGAGSVRTPPGTAARAKESNQLADFQIKAAKLKEQIERLG